MKQRHQLPHLLKLLDDNSESTQVALSEQFQSFDGDISDDIAELGIDLSPEDRYKLANYLHPSRRARLQSEWIVPVNLDDDWDGFEHLVRVICDFLHDGVSPRPSLHDSLDSLAENILEKVPDISVNDLRSHLFENHLYTGARTNYYSLHNSDLCYTLDTGKGNPLTLAILFLLVARRLKCDVTACNYPGHFLARISLAGKPHLVDCYNMGRLIPVDKLLLENKDISAEAKFAIHAPAPARVILHRILRNIEHSFLLEKRTSDAVLMQKLQETLIH